MGDIERRKDSKGAVTYRARVRRRGHPARYATFATKTHAKDWIEQEERKIRAGIRLDEMEAQKRTLNEAIERFLKDPANKITNTR